MLPAGICRDIYGPRKRPAADFTSVDAQLVGRSRSERLLDGIYNRHSKKMRSDAFERRQKELKIRLLQRKTVKRGSSTSSNEQLLKIEQATRHRLKISSAAKSLVKHVTTKPKFIKVVNLAQQLVDSSYTPDEKETFLNLLTSFALSPHCATVAEARLPVIKLFQTVSMKLLSQPIEKNDEGTLSGSKIPSPYNATVDEISSEIDQDVLVEFLDTPISLESWISILCIPGILHSKLFTDDTFQFNNSLSHISKRIEKLPALDKLLAFKQNGIETISLQIPTMEEFLNAIQERCQADTQIKSEVQTLEVKKETDQNSETQEMSIQQSISSQPSDSVANQSERLTETDIHQEKKNSLIGRTSLVLGSSNNTTTSTVVSSIGTSSNSSAVIGSRNNNDGNSRIDDMELFDHGEDGEEQYLPTRRAAFHLERQFLFNCLATAFQFARTRWARTAVAELFQRVYLQRHTKFTEAESIHIEKWQSDIRSLSLAAKSPSILGQSLDIGESRNPVKDGREEKIFASHGGQVWSAKQTGA